jgi:D-glutamate cyclase
MQSITHFIFLIAFLLTVSVVDAAFFNSLFYPSTSTSSSRHSSESIMLESSQSFPQTSPQSSAKIKKMETIIGQDEGNRGMKDLIVPNDLEKAATILTNLNLLKKSSRSDDEPPHVLILSGFPCCVDKNPPTETDGPPGAIAIAKCCLALGYKVTLVTDESNQVVFTAAAEPYLNQIHLEIFPAEMSTEDDRRLDTLTHSCDLIVSCERAGPAEDGICRTMRGIDMNAKNLIAPLHKIVESTRSGQLKTPTPYIAIGDGGNELGMGKVIDVIRDTIPNGKLIGAVTAADYLIAASVSNWGGYALCAACAVLMNQYSEEKQWRDKCIPSIEEEIELLNRCVAVGCRDGVSGLMEATVDGMPLDTSMKCLEQLRNTV